jgi:hypothetical protein
VQRADQPDTGTAAVRPAPVTMKGLAVFRVVLGTFAWVAPRTMNRIFGVPRRDDSPALIYMNRVFGVRAISLGVGYLTSSGEARALWQRLWLLCDAADTAMGVAMTARGELSAVTAVQALAITGGATAIDLAAIGRSSTARCADIRDVGSLPQQGTAKGGG